MATDEDVNRRYYGSVKQGQRDYWKFMAAPRWRIAKVISILNNVSLKSLVDLGCGDGSLLTIISHYFPRAQLAGVDMSPTEIESNRKGNPTVNWHVMDFDSSCALAPGLGGAFDAVVALEVIEHVADPARLLSHAFAMARPGGRLILSTQSGPLRETEKRVGHRRHFTAEEMTGIVKSAGWRTLKVWNSGWPFHDLSKWVANLFPNRSMRHFGEEAYSLPQKMVCLCLRVLFKLNSLSRGAQLFVVAEKPHLHQEP